MIQPLASLRLFGLAVYGARYGLAATPRARTRLWQSQTVRFAPTAPYHTITILLGEAPGSMTHLLGESAQCIW